MDAVWFRVRADLRRRWRSWLFLSLLVAIVGGTAMAAAAGARRTESAFPRFVATTNPADVAVDVGDYTGDQTALLDRIQELPQVADSYRPTLFISTITAPGGQKLRFPEVLLFGDPEGRVGRDLDRIRIVEGRDADPVALYEITTNPVVAERLHLHPGSMLDAELFDARSFDLSKPSLTTRFRLVGIYVSHGEFENLSGTSSEQIMRVTRAFARANGTLGLNISVNLKLRNGSAGISALAKDLTVLGAPREPEDARSNYRGVQELNRTQVTALTLLCALLVLAGLAMVGQAVARQEFLGSLDNGIFRALGSPRSQIFVASMVRTAIILVAGVSGAVGVAYLLSPLAPIGQARLAEPHPGFAFDGWALPLGAIAVFLIGMVLAAWPAWRAARAGSEPDAPPRPSTVAAGFTAAGLPPSATVGATLALEAGRGRRAVPVRTAMLGSALAIGALAVSLGFASSIDRLIDRPALSGYTFDATVFFDIGGVSETRRIVSRAPFVSSTWEATEHVVHIAGMEMNLVAESGPAPSPAIIDGRPARSADEILLDTKTMRILGFRIGDRVTIQAQPYEGDETPPPVAMTVVGRFAVPRLAFQNARPDQGVGATMDGARRIYPRVQPEAVFVRFRPGTDLERASEELQGLFPGTAVVLVRRLPAQLQNLARIRSISLVLVLVVGLMGAMTLIDALVSTIRRRGRDLAVLKALGFTRRQVSAAVAWQATLLIVLAVPPALVAGVAGGRVLWRAFGNRIGFVPQAVVPVPALVLAVAGALALANLVAALPGRAASRTRAALVLRTE